MDFNNQNISNRPSGIFRSTIPSEYSKPLPDTHEYLLNTLDIFETQIQQLGTALHHYAKLSRRPVRLAATAERLTGENSDLLCENAALSVQCQKLTKENTKLILDNEQTKAQNDRLRANCSGFMFEENRMLKKKLEMADKEVKELQERCKELKVEVSNYEEEIKLLTEDDDVYREEAEEAMLDRE